MNTNNVINTVPTEVIDLAIDLAIQAESAKEHGNDILAHARRSELAGVFHTLRVLGYSHKSINSVERRVLKMLDFRAGR